MTTLMDKALEIVRSWPADQQDDAAELLLRSTGLARAHIAHQPRNSARLTRR